MSNRYGETLLICAYLVFANMRQHLAKRERAILLGMPPQVLLDHRMSNRPIYITQNTMWKVAYPEGYSIGGKDVGGKHNLGIEVLKQLPEQLADPLAITNNTVNQQNKKMTVLLSGRTGRHQAVES